VLERGQHLNLSHKSLPRRAEVVGLEHLDRRAHPLAQAAVASEHRAHAALAELALDDPFSDTITRDEHPHLTPKRLLYRTRGGEL
jgi:phosphoglycolate phosphatase-like HAD superfamily hydrolase